MISRNELLKIVERGRQRERGIDVRPLSER
jgi:hypothetical protein